MIGKRMTSSRVAPGWGVGLFYDDLAVGAYQEVRRALYPGGLGVCDARGGGGSRCRAEVWRGPDDGGPEPGRSVSVWPEPGRPGQLGLCVEAGVLSRGVWVSRCVLLWVG